MSPPLALRKASQPLTVQMIAAAGEHLPLKALPGLKREVACLRHTGRKSAWREEVTQATAREHGCAALAQTQGGNARQRTLHQAAPRKALHLLGHKAAAARASFDKAFGMQLAIGGLHRIARDTQGLGQGSRCRQAPAHVQRAIEDQLPYGPLDADMQRQGAMSGVADPGFDGFELGVLEQMVCIPAKKWPGVSGHFDSINLLPHGVKHFSGSPCKTMSTTHSPSSLRWNDLTHPVVAGLISVIVNYGGTFILVFQAAKVAGLGPELTASWVWSISIGVGLTGLLLSWVTREPIITAWSTPAAAFLVTALASTPYAEAVGAYLLSALAFVVLGLSGYFERVIRLIPAGIAAGLLAGILLQFGIKAFGGMSVDPMLAGLLIATYVVLKRISARYAVVGILVLGLVFLLSQNRVDLSGLELQLAAPVFTRPEFSLNALLSVALPLFLITLTGQYMPGMLVLRNDGFKTSANPIVTITGLGSLLMAPFGSHAFNIAAITAAIATGPQAHEDPSRRWIAGVAAGMCYILVGVFGVTLAAVFMAFPATFITTLAGLALLGTIGASLATALADAKVREAALITFLAAAANITLLGIGGAFWGLVIGLLAYAVLNGRLPLSAQSGAIAAMEKG